MFSLSVCRVSVFSRRSWNVFCRGNRLSAGFADMLRQKPNFHLQKYEADHPSFLKGRFYCSNEKTDRRTKDLELEFC